MITIIVFKKENANEKNYRFAITGKVYTLYQLQQCVKRNLLEKEKEIKKVWKDGTKLTASIYLDRNFSGCIDFEL